MLQSLGFSVRRPAMSGDAKAETPAAVEADEDLLNIIQYSSSRVYGIPCIETRLFHMVINHFLIGMQRQVWFQSICSFPYFHIFPVGVYLFWRFQKCTCPVFCIQESCAKKKHPDWQPHTVNHSRFIIQRWSLPGIITFDHWWNLMKYHETGIFSTTISNHLYINSNPQMNPQEISWLNFAFFHHIAMISRHPERKNTLDSAKTPNDPKNLHTPSPELGFHFNKWWENMIDTEAT